MASFNKIIMLGNMTRDPELTYLPSQTPVVDFGLASTRKFKGADGQMKEDTCFVDCRLYGARAEVVSKYFSKGKPIFIEGRLQLDRWEAQDGTKRSKHRIVVDNFEFVGGRNDGSGGGYQTPQSNAADTYDDEGAPSPNDDIPF